MVKMGKDGDIRKNDYDEWPLFKDFRKSQEYIDAYKNVFGDSTATKKLANMDLSQGEALRSHEEVEQLDNTQIEDPTLQ